MGVKYQTTSFIGGILSPKLKARVDSPEYQNGLEECENFLVEQLGSVTFRPGTYYCTEVKDSDYAARILPHYADGRAYFVEVSDGYIRVYLANRNNLSTYESQIASPWEEEEVSEVQYVQQGTDMYVNHASYAPRKITKEVDPTEDGGQLYGIAYDGSSVYVVVAYATGKIYSSTDLSTWTLRHTITGETENKPTGVVYAEGKFVVSNKDGTIAVASADGTTWNEETLSATDKYGHCIAHGNSLFIIGGYPASTFLTRPDTDAAGSGTWTARTVAGVSTTRVSGIAYDGSSYFCASFFNGTIATSTNGTSWSMVASEDYEDGVTISQGWDIAYGDGMFIAVGYYRDASLVYHGAILINTDVGTNKWQRVSIREGASHAETCVQGIAYGDGKFVVVCRDGRTYYSTNGISWTQGVIPVTPPDYNPNITFINSTFFCFGEKGFATSTDGINWSLTWNMTTPTFTGGDGTFDEAGEYPKCVTLHEGRLIFARNIDKPLTVWGSEIGGLDAFDTSVGTNDDDPFEFSLTQNLGSRIEWIVGQDLLYIATDRAIWKVGSLTDVLSPTTVFYPKQLAQYQATPNIQPALVGNMLAFPQDPGKKIRLIEYSHERHKYFTPEITIKIDHLMEGKAKRLAWQMTPQPYLWVVLQSGDCLVCLFDPTAGLTAWSFLSTDGSVEDICIVPGEEQDQVYLLVNRLIDGETKRYIEYVMFDAWDDEEDAFHVDCGITWEGKSSTTITEITKSATCQITFSQATFDNDELIRISGVTDMTEVNSQVYMLKNKSGSQYDLYDETGTTQIDSSGFSAAADDGEAEEVKKTIDGLDHLEGEEVVSFGDGVVLAAETVASGEVTLDAYVHKVHVGLSYTGTIKPMPFPGARDRYKRISALYVDLYKTMGGTYGNDEDNMISFRETASGLATVSEKLSFPGALSRDVQPIIQQSDPQPMTILGIIAEVQ